MTPQFSDTLIINGIEKPLRSNPLEDFFTLFPPRPNFIRFGSFCRRGYVATWEVKENQLMLTGIGKPWVCSVPQRHRTEQGMASCSHDHNGPCYSRYVTVSDLMPTVNGEAVAAWYTGTLEVPHGEMTLYIHNDYASHYERYLLVDVEYGQVTEIRIVGNEERQSTLKKERLDMPAAETETWWERWV
jgi:hypothetical protein